MHRSLHFAHRCWLFTDWFYLPSILSHDRPERLLIRAASEAEITFAPPISTLAFVSVEHTVASASAILLDAAVQSLRAAPSPTGHFPAPRSVSVGSPSSGPTDITPTEIQLRQPLGRSRRFQKSWLSCDYQEQWSARIKEVYIP